MATVAREEVAAALEARRELGRGYEDEIVDGLVEKIERRLDERARMLPARQAHREHRSVTPLALGSIGCGIAVTAIALKNADGWGAILVALTAWIAIAVINLAY